jgi:2-methylisocitrate lyase-like PEP mutase family enzyme
MSSTTTTTSPAIATFRKLHESGCFMLPNPWDVGSAVFLWKLGFKALASTSAGFAFSRGVSDDVGAIPRDEVLTHLRELVRATPLPVNADFQDGYSRDVEKLAANVTACVHTGVAGLSIEDATGDASVPLYGRDRAIERVRAARAAIDATGIPVILTARCEAYLVNDPDAHRIVLDRLPEFAAAGADCLYAPRIYDPAAITAIVRAVAPKPVNVLMSGPVAGLTFERLAEMGVRRVSVGGGLARAAWGGFLRAARLMAEKQSFDGLADAASFDELNNAFRKKEDR